MIAALNKRTGEVLWRTPMQRGGQTGKDGAGYSSVVVSNGGGVKQYVTTFSSDTVTTMVCRRASN